MTRIHSIPAPVHLQGAEMMDIKNYQNKSFHQTNSKITIFGNQKHEVISKSIVVTIATTTDTQSDEEHAFYRSTGQFTRVLKSRMRKLPKIDYFAKQTPNAPSFLR